MRKLNFKNVGLVILGVFVLSISVTSCKKDTAKPGNDNNSNTGIHYVDSKFVGKWLWSEGSDGAYYDNNGVYQGASYGLALQYNINADGSGSCFNHLFSTLGPGTDLEVNISYKGFFESDDQGHLGFFPLSGTYKSTSGENRALRPDELWNAQTNTGKSFLYQKVVFTKQGERQCFQVTASNNVVDTYFKMP